MSASAGKRKRASEAEDTSPPILPPPSKPLSDRCELACYHAAFCGRGPKEGGRAPANTSDLNFQGVLDYLSSSPPIDFKLVPAAGAVDWDKYSFVVAMNEGFHLSLLSAAVASEWDHMENKNDVAKRAIFEMVLLAGAAFDDDRIRKFAGTALFEAGGGVHYSSDFVCALLDRCTATAAARLARWPGVIAEINAAAARAAQCDVIHSRFLEICCEGKVDGATFDEMLTFFDDSGFIPKSKEWMSRSDDMWMLLEAMQNKKDTGNVFGNRH